MCKSIEESSIVRGYKMTRENMHVNRIAIVTTSVLLRVSSLIWSPIPSPAMGVAVVVVAAGVVVLVVPLPVSVAMGRL